jgi:short-subunit dehydrogenase
MDAKALLEPRKNGRDSHAARHEGANACDSRLSYPEALKTVIGGKSPQSYKSIGRPGTVKRLKPCQHFIRENDHVRNTVVVVASERRFLSAGFLPVKEMEMYQVYPGMALITGASSGIGAMYADRLAHRGYDLVLVARNRQRLEIVAARIARRTGRRIEVLAADLTDPTDLATVEQVLLNSSCITMLVNNAGIGATAPLLASEVDKMSQMIALNVGALTRLTYAAAPVFVARGLGTIINVASIVAVHPELLNGVYAGTKAFVLAFSRSLHHELADKGVRIQVVLPGATATDFWGIAGLPVEELPAEWVMPAGEMVDAALAGLDQGELVTLPSLPDPADWTAYESARQSLFPKLSRSSAAYRYRVAGPRSTETKRGLLW